MKDANCDKNKLILYLYDELDANGKLIVEKHLRNCTECQVELQECRETICNFTELPSLEPARINYAIPDRLMRTAWPRWVAAAAAVLCLALILPFFHNTKQHQTMPSQTDEYDWDNGIDDQISAVSKQTELADWKFRIVTIAGMDDSLSRTKEDIEDLQAIDFTD